MPLREFLGCRDRIARAKEHYKCFGDNWSSFIRDDPYSTKLTVNADGTGHLRIEKGYERFPPIFTLELGEFLYQLRASLDASIYACVVRETGQDPPTNEERLEFPIVTTPEAFKKVLWKIPVAPERIRIIESVQPYHVPEGLAPEKLVFSCQRTLDILNGWARIDRHRRLHLVGSWASNANPQFRVSENAFVSQLFVTYDGFLEVDGVIAEFRVDGWREGMDIEANPDVLIDVMVREDPPPVADNDTLGERMKAMTIWVPAIVDELEKSFSQ